MAQPPVDPGMQHQPPALFYCWKYWLNTGDVAEGCTAVDPLNQSSMPDLNMYGWVYIVLPLAGLFLLLMFFYFCCGGKSTTPKHKVLLENV